MTVCVYTSEYLHCSLIQNPLFFALVHVEGDWGSVEDMNVHPNLFPKRGCRPILTALVELANKIKS